MKGTTKMTEEEYLLHCHRVQTGIKILMENQKSTDTTPKHLRTGIDLSKADMAGLANLLIDKGVFTFEEYKQAIFKATKDEADRYEKEVQTLFGNHIRLG